jgi:hypothetical protein
VSVEHGAWAVSARNQAVLSEAFRTSEAVVLFLTMPQTGGFQGYARMGTAVGQFGGALAWPGFANARANFGVAWQQVVDVPNAMLQHLLLPLSEGRAAPMTRDAQELPQPVAEQMVGGARCPRRLGPRLALQAGCTAAAAAPPRRKGRLIHSAAAPRRRGSSTRWRCTRARCRRPCRSARRLGSSRRPRPSAVAACPTGRPPWRGR